MLAKYLRLYHTLKYLKPIQIYWRLWKKCYRPKPAVVKGFSIRRIKKSWVSSIEKKQSLFGRWEFCFLNTYHNCSFPEDWNSESLDKLWLYNLHYFDDLCGDTSVERGTLQLEYIEKWIEENPPGYGNGWEPYPISLRIVNWIKWSLQGGRLSQSALESLSLQAAYLIKSLEYHLLGNHLFANAKALVFAGLFFQGRKAEKLLKKGLSILKQEIPEQILGDGGHFERSPMYHAILLEDMLDLCNLFAAYGLEFSDFWAKKVDKMLFWLEYMCHPDGEISLFNDAAFGVATSPENIFKYASRLGISNLKRSVAGLKVLENSGYVVYLENDLAAILDVGKVGPDYLPGHAHADSLSFELSCFGERVVVDSGISCYGVSEERLRQRKTCSHNTVVIDGMDSSEVWDGFRVARRAYPFSLYVEEGDSRGSVRCCHDGYSRLPGKVVHCREWRFVKHSLVIIDRLHGEYGEACALLHLHPSASLFKEGDSHCIVVLGSGRRLNIEVDGGTLATERSTYHPEFGVSLANICIKIQLTKATCTSTITWE